MRAPRPVKLPPAPSRSSGARSLASGASLDNASGEVRCALADGGHTATEVASLRDFGDCAHWVIWPELVQAPGLGLGVRLRAVVELLVAVENLHLALAPASPGQHAAPVLQTAGDEPGQGEAEVSHHFGALSPETVRVWDDGVVTLVVGGGGPKTLGAYSVPEIRAGGSPSRLSDIYVVGVLLYEALRGRGVDGLGALRLADCLAWVDRQFVGSDAGSGRALSEVLLRALHPAPVERWASAGEFAEALSRVPALEGTGREELSSAVRAYTETRADRATPVVSAPSESGRVPPLRPSKVDGRYRC